LSHEENYVFNSVHTVAAYLQHLSSIQLSPIRTHKSLYYLFACFGAYYGSITQNNVHEGSLNYSNKLFPARFEAWDSGPVIRDLFEENKDCYYNQEQISFSILEIEKHNEVMLFIQELFEQLSSLSEFTLRTISTSDECYIKARQSGMKTNEISMEEMFNEYKHKNLMNN